MPTEGQMALTADGLVKRYGERVALYEVSLRVGAGERVAIIGPNGAGKTTLLSMLAGVIRPDAGSVSAPGEIGWVPQSTALYNKLTVAENLRLFARLEGVEDCDAAVEKMLAQTALEERADDQVGTLSGGNRQRVNIAIGLIAEPSVLLLDEPSTSLDPVQRARLWEFIGGLSERGIAILYSTHVVPEADRYATSLLILDGGVNIFSGSPDQLHDAVGRDARDFEAAFVEFLLAKERAGIAPASEGHA